MNEDIKKAVDQASAALHESAMWLSGIRGRGTQMVLASGSIAGGSGLHLSMANAVVEIAVDGAVSVITIKAIT